MPKKRYGGVKRPTRVGTEPIKATVVSSTATQTTKAQPVLPKKLSFFDAMRLGWRRRQDARIARPHFIIAAAVGVISGYVRLKGWWCAWQWARGWGGAHCSRRTLHVLTRQIKRNSTFLATYFAYRPSK